MGRLIEDENVTPLEIKRHIGYFKRFIYTFPPQFYSFDTTRPMIIFFSVSGLDLLNALDTIEQDKNEIREWIYSLLVIPPQGEDMSKVGFLGSGSLINPNGEQSEFLVGHLALTYTCLATLIILGDDLSRVNKKAIMTGVKALQQENGSFCCTLHGSENDMRFVYCAAAVCYILQDWSGMDKERTVAFIQKSISYDSGIGQGPGLEAHGGATYCGIAALYLMGQLEATLTTAQLIDSFEFVDFKENRKFIMTTQKPIGGFAKSEDSFPDPMHAYLGLGGLSLMGEDGIREINPALNISKRAADYLKELHHRWQSQH